MHDVKHGALPKRVYRAGAALFLAARVEEGWVVTRIDGKRIFSELVSTDDLEGWIRRYDSDAYEIAEEAWELLPYTLTA